MIKQAPKRGVWSGPQKSKPNKNPGWITRRRITWLIIKLNKETDPNKRDKLKKKLKGLETKASDQGDFKDAYDMYQRDPMRKRGPVVHQK